MKNDCLSLFICFFISFTGFVQETQPKTYKASKVTNTLYGKENTITNKDTSTPVGSMSARGGGGTVNGSMIADLSIANTGGLSYKVPINVPPGLNGVQPEIALTFDSQSGNGLAGWGWNVSGVSVITRIPSTLFHDNKIDPVDFDLDDRFALDGKRLIVKTGNYGSSGSVYQTEQYSNVKVVAYENHPDPNVQGPKYFKVFYPDGSIGHYGLNDDSRSHTDYAISYWENPQGIRISYTYSNTHNTLSIKTIKYGSRGVASPINEIEFSYSDRKFIETSYIGGILFMRDEQLSQIDVRGNGGGLYRNYYLSSTNSSLSYGRITSIIEKTSDPSETRTITFRYKGLNYDSSGIHDLGLQEIYGQATTLGVSEIEQRNAKVVPMDISGNGKMDFIVYPTIGADAKKKFWVFNDIQNSQGFNYSATFDEGYFQEMFPISWLNDVNKLMPSQGLALVQNTGNNQTVFKVMAYSNDNSPMVQRYTKTWNAPTYKPENYCNNNNASLNRVPLEYISGDFNGDGLSDVMAIERKYTTTNCFEQPAVNDPTCPNKVTRDGVQYCCYGCSTSTFSTSSVHLIELDRRKTTNFAAPAGNLGRELKYTDQVLTMDANGDGKTDVLQFTDGKVYVYSLNHNNSMQLLWETTDTVIDLDYPILPGDYNGDGKADFMLPTANNSDHFVMFLSTGTGFKKEDYQHQTFEYKHSFDQQGTLYGYNLLPVDMNGDGKTDIIEYNTITYNNNSNGTQYIRLHQNTVKFISSQKPSFIPSDPIQTTGNLKHYPIPIFLSSNEENNNLEFATISNKWVRNYVSSLKDHREDITLEQITNNGLTTMIRYDQVNLDYTDVDDQYFFKSYNADYDQIFPFVNVNVAPAFRVVRELEQTGSGITRRQRFYYKGAVSHANGLGFMGFDIVKRSNWYVDGVTALWNITKQDPMLRGAVIEQITANTSLDNPSTYMTKVNYFYDYKLIANPGSPIAPQYPITLNRSSFIPGQQTDQAEQSITLSNGFHAIGSNGAYWADIFPPEEQPGDVGYAGAVDIRLDRMETDNGLTGVFTTEAYNYDAYNNPLVKTTTYPGGSRVVNYQYFNNPTATNNTYHVGRLKNRTEQVTLNGNSFSTEEQYTYNNNLVTQIKKKGNGTGWLTEDFTHDANGNIISRSLTDGTITRTEEFEYGTTYGGRFLTKSIDIEDLETQYEYFTDTGNLKKVTNPYGLITSYLYDKWDRLEKETDYLTNATDHTYIELLGGELEHRIDYADGSKEMTKYNAFGWTIRSGSLSLNNQWAYIDQEFYVDGRLKRESEPHTGSPSQWNTTVYDEYGRPISQQLYTGRTITITYSGLSSTVNDGVKSVTTTLDALGNTVKVQDPGGTIDYTYFSNGTLKTADYGGHVVTVGIDGWGRKTSLNDPSAGNYTYSYNGLGELLEETTPKGTTTYTYDTYGKVLTKEITGDLTDLSLTYVYDNVTKQLTDINGVDNTNSARVYSYDYEYDNYERPNVIKENTGLANFEYRMTYDTYGRVHKETQITTLTGGASKTVVTRNVYDTSGILKEIWNDGTPDKLWELNSINARGQALTVTLGNGLVKNKMYDSYGYLTQIEDKESGTNPTVALHMDYDFNAQRGTLNSRENFGLNWQETFGYDNLDRLTTISGDVTKTMAYDAYGRIASNTSLGDYAYDNGNRYRLAEITPNASGTPYFQQHPTQQISYNAFKKPVDIHQSGHGRVSFEYGPLMNRSTAYYGGEDEDRALRRYRKHYSAIIPVEIVEDTQANTTKIVTYVGGDAYSAPIAHIKRTGTGALDEYHYLHRDYLGSILAITDADGDVIEERQFGAWGSVDKFLDNAANTTFGHTGLLGRGYTGHEHFFEVSLIHMNGRMYDPQLGKFLSPDNHIQDPFNTQNYNRYGYVLNNPLMYVDPSGEAWEWLIPAAIFGLWQVANAIFGNHDANPYDNPGNYGNSELAPTNKGNNSQMASSMSQESRGGPGRSLEWATLGNSFEYSAPAIGSRYRSSNGPYGISLTGKADPLQGLAPPNGFAPSNGATSDSFGITAEDVADTVLDFVPIAGGVKDIYKGIRDGDGWQVAMGAGFVILDVFTLGSASLVKGAVKTGVKIGYKSVARAAVKNVVKHKRLYTKSTSTYGQRTHLAYKAGKHAPELNRFKEFTGVPGMRPDFIDFNTRTIYELKPFNPRQIKQGTRQLNNYKARMELRTGETWKTVLEFY